MDEYRKPYLTLFNSVTDAPEALERQNYGTAKETLIHAQQTAEDTFINEG